MKTPVKLSGSNIFDDIKQLINESKRHIAVEVNMTMSMLYWNIGTSEVG